MAQSKQWILNAHPEASPVLEGANPTFKQEKVSFPALKDGQVLLKILYLSNDPAQRCYLTKYADERRLYVPPTHPGEVVRANSLSEVVESKASHLNKGDIVRHATGWTQFTVVDAASLQPLTPLPNGASITNYLGALGLTGLTAYHGLLNVAHATKNDVVVVSGAAGATGSMAVQIAKKIVGCKKVIGIAGGPQKCAWVQQIGADVCLDYKSADWKHKLTAETPDFVNVYYDNVGGDILNTMLGRMAREGRVAACGAISEYNADTGDKGAKMTNWFDVIAMRLLIKGFIVLDFSPDQHAEATAVLRKGLEEGKLDITGGEHVVESTFDDVPKTWMKLFEGANTGKLVTKLV